MAAFRSLLPWAATAFLNRSVHSTKDSMNRCIRFRVCSSNSSPFSSKRRVRPKRASSARASRRPERAAKSDAAPSGRPLLVEQALKLLRDHAVALAGRGFQAAAIDYPEVAAPVGDQPLPLKGARYLAYAGTPHAQHLGEKLLG